MAFFVTDAPAKRALTIFSLSKLEKSPILLHGLSLNTIANTLTRALQSVNKREEEHSMLPTEVLSV
jgi:hypothetical protein